MKLSDLEGAANLDKGSLRRTLTKLQSWATSLELAVGVSPNSEPGEGRMRVAPPSLASLAVTGGGGRFVIEIGLSKDLVGPVTHEIKISETVPFMASTTVETLPENPATRIEIATPNIIRYFQLRSRYYASDWNQPVLSKAIDSGAPAEDLVLTLGAEDSGGIGFKLVRVGNEVADEDVVVLGGTISEVGPDDSGGIGFKLLRIPN